MSLRLPCEIEADIRLLNEELERSKAFYEYSFLCSASTFISNSLKSTISNFNLVNLSGLLELIFSGKELKGIHGVYGEFFVKLNSQKNRFIISPEVKDLTTGAPDESNILYFLSCFYPCSWYIRTSDK